MKVKRENACEVAIAQPRRRDRKRGGDRRRRWGGRDADEDGAGVQFSPCRRVLFDTPRYNINDVGVINGMIVYCKVSEHVLPAVEVCSLCRQTLIKCQYDPKSPSYYACLCD